MGKYILNRILRSLLSLVAVMILTIVLIYSLMDRDALVTNQEGFNKNINNDRVTFTYEVWQNYGYVETYSYTNFCRIKYSDPKSEEFQKCISIEEVFTSKESYCKITSSDLVPGEYEECMQQPRTYLIDSDIPEIAEFIELYESNGYEIIRRDPVPADLWNNEYDDNTDTPSDEEEIVEEETPSVDESENTTVLKANENIEDETPENPERIQLVTGGSGILFAYRSKSTFVRLWEFFKQIFFFDGKNYYKTVNEERERIGKPTIQMDTYIRFEKDMNNVPALKCSGCKNQYLLYFDNKFPFIHQNWITINLGRSMTYGKDTVEVMTDSQLDPIIEDVTYPNGEVVEDTHRVDFHACQINPSPTAQQLERYQGYYSNCPEVRSGKSMMGFSFVIGIIATITAYVIGVPIGILMAKHKGKLIDKIGICYIIFIMAVPSLAYIYIFRRIGFNAGLPTELQLATGPQWVAYILPIICLALPSIGSLMSWIRRYMIDQMNSDYVKFARAKGLSELEIFNKHIFKNAAIPIIHNIPGGLLGSLTGALLTERIFGIPGVGKLFTDAIEKTDNGMLVGLTFFYAILSITALILGDVLMAIVDPRISFADKGGRK